MFGPMLFYHIVIDTSASQRVLHLMCSYSILAILMNYCTALALQRVQCWHLFYSLSIIVIDFHTVYLAMKFVNRSLLVKVKKQRKCCVVERRIMFQCKNQTKCPVCVHVSIQQFLHVYVWYGAMHVWSLVTGHQLSVSSGTDVTTDPDTGTSVNILIFFSHP